MAGTMSEADLVIDLKASLFDAKSVFTSPDDGDYKRFLQQALPDMQFKRPVTRLGSLTLSPDEGRYQVQEADFAALKTDIWREPTKLPKPWEPSYPGALPRVTGKTGVEMEALTAASVACLTIYDMAKAVDRGMVISGIRLIEKTGGKSGDYRAAGD